MFGRAVTILVGLLLSLLIGCFNRDVPPKNELAGPNELMIVNKTSRVIHSVTVASRREPRSSEQHPLVGGGTDSNAHEIAPGGSVRGAYRPGHYFVTAWSINVVALEHYELDVRGPVQIVIYQGEKPSNVSAPPGYEQLFVPDWDEVHKKEVAATTASESSRCKATVDLTRETPAPGRTKVDGSWTCVLGGSAKGTNYVKLVQLADGKITATISGTDRNTTWEGIVKNDEVRYRYAEWENSGGVLKVDPGGHAMKGSGVDWHAKDHHCSSYTVTCTK